MFPQLFRTKSIEQLVREADRPEHRLQRVLGPWSMAALGIGAIIGTGIYILAGTAAAGETFEVESWLKAPLLDLLLHGSDATGLTGRPGAGPAVAVSFVLVALVCVLAAFCYAELSSAIPIAGSAYTYTYATLGELAAWIMGWNLILEYAVSNMAVAVGFSAYFDSLLRSLGITLPRTLMEPTFFGGEPTGAYFNLPCSLVILFLTVLLVTGIRESSRANTIMVFVKIAALLVFVFAAMPHVEVEHWRPFFPNGWQGVLAGGSLVFFTYIGFDSVATAAEECKNPQRDLPFGILMSLAACAVLYVAVALVLTGIQPWETLANAAPVAQALEAIGLGNVQRWVTVGALTGMVSSLLVFQLGLTRIGFAMSRDRLLPAAFSKVHPRYRTPHISTWTAGLLVGIPAGLFDIGTLAEIANIGTLFAFVMVSAAVLILRRTQPELKRGFRVPWSPWLPLLSLLACLILMAGLPVETWLQFFVWIGIGLAVYFLYSGRRSPLGQGKENGASASNKGAVKGSK